MDFMGGGHIPTLHLITTRISTLRHKPRLLHELSRCHGSLLSVQDHLKSHMPRYHPKTSFVIRPFGVTALGTFASPFPA